MLLHEISWGKNTVFKIIRKVMFSQLLNKFNKILETYNHCIWKQLLFQSIAILCMFYYDKIMTMLSESLPFH